MQSSSSSSNSRKSLNLEKIYPLLAPEGRIGLFFKGYQFRTQQQEMLRNVVEAYNHQQIALIEAGTGTGKSMAYLLPALLWAVVNKERTLLSTHTINLQEQLIKKDIPLLVNALGIECKAVLVKGMGHYVCLRKLRDVQDELGALSEQEQQDIQAIEGWSRVTKEGSRQDLTFNPLNSSWEKVNAEMDTCNNNECPFFNSCHFFKARKEAHDAQLLVANHHLLFADIACRAEGDKYEGTAILPPYQHVIIDEAHHVEDVATAFFAQQVSRVEIMRTLARLASERHGQASGRVPLLRKKIAQTIGKEMTKSSSALLNRLTIDLPGMRRDVIQQLAEAFQTISRFLETVLQAAREDEGSSMLPMKMRLKKEQYSHPGWKDEVGKITGTFIQSARSYLLALFSLVKEVQALPQKNMQEQLAGILLDIQAYAQRLEKNLLVLEGFMASAPVSERVRWVETEQLNTLQNLCFVDAELEIGMHLYHAFFERFKTVVLCSATLTTNQKFDFLRQRLGLAGAHLQNRKVTENIYDSPFNYAEQALLAVPTDMPGPQEATFFNASLECIWQAIEASRGNAFVLFTSYGMLQRCAEALRERFQRGGYTLFKQGEQQRQILLDRFKVTDRSVLFGTDSFWEGVDVAGDALRLVIIVKLPFKVPSEPLTQARADAIIERGGDPFMEYSIPHAIVKFKQGFGRLMRNQKDRGCIVCLDSRLIRKNYGKLFLNSLPDCQRLFAPSQEVWQGMRSFYKKTYALTL